MPLPFQRGEVGADLAKFLALKGVTTLGLDESVVPVIQLVDLTDSPYMSYAVPCARGLAVAGVALNFSYVLARAGRGKVLQIRQVIINNTDVAAQTFNVKLGGDTFLAQLDTVGAENPFHRLNDPETVPSNLSSSLQTANDVAGTDTGATGNLARFDIPAATAVIWTPSDPIVLHGNSPAGRQILSVKLAVNVAIGFSASFNGREWPLIGQ